MNKRHILIGILVIIAISFLLVVQVDFFAYKKEQINMYVFQDVTIDRGLSFKDASPKATDLIKEDSYVYFLKEFSLKVIDQVI